MKIRVYNIEWDTDGEDIFLPSEVIINNYSDQEISDILSDEYGFCIKGAKYEILES